MPETHITCEACEKPFTSRKPPSKAPKNCSKECAKASRNSKAAAAWRVEGARERRSKAQTEGIAKAMSDPVKAAHRSAISSAHMKRLHADPAFQKRRDDRSSRVMLANWGKYRDQFLAQASARYARFLEAGVGICSEVAKGRKAEASMWIMKRANQFLHTETDYNTVFTDAVRRLRRENPYDGPLEGSDYLDYCRMIGIAVTSSPECRDLADTFMSGAIPRAAAEWNAKKKEGEDQ